MNNKVSETFLIQNDFSFWIEYNIETFFENKRKDLFKVINNKYDLLMFINKHIINNSENITEIEDFLNEIKRSKLPVDISDQHFNEIKRHVINQFLYEDILNQIVSKYPLVFIEYSKLDSLYSIYDRIIIKHESEGDCELIFYNPHYDTITSQQSLSLLNENKTDINPDILTTIDNYYLSTKKEQSDIFYIEEITKKHIKFIMKLIKADKSLDEYRLNEYNLTVTLNEKNGLLYAPVVNIDFFKADYSLTFPLLLKRDIEKKSYYMDHYKKTGGDVYTIMDNYIEGVIHQHFYQPILSGEIESILQKKSISKVLSPHLHNSSFVKPRL